MYWVAFPEFQRRQRQRLANDLKQELQHSGEPADVLNRKYEQSQIRWPIKNLYMGWYDSFSRHPKIRSVFFLFTLYRCSAKHTSQTSGSIYSNKYCAVVSNSEFCETCRRPVRPQPWTLLRDKILHGFLKSEMEKCLFYNGKRRNQTWPVEKSLWANMTWAETAWSSA